MTKSEAFRRCRAVSKRNPGKGYFVVQEYCSDHYGYEFGNDFDVDTVFNGCPILAVFEGGERVG